MARALFVSVNETFPQAALPGQQPVRGGAPQLHLRGLGGRAATEGSNTSSRRPGQVKSASGVTHPNVADWPTIPPGALGGGFRCVPVVDVDTAEWTTATGSAGIPMAGRILYGTVQVDAAGRLVGTPGISLRGRTSPPSSNLVFIALTRKANARRPPSRSREAVGRAPAGSEYEAGFGGC